MRLYFAATCGQKFEENAYNIGMRSRLLSFADIETSKNEFAFWLNHVQGGHLFIDSGAFSAFNSGTSIDINQYIAFLQQYQHKITVYAGLDVIGDWHASSKNIEYMETKGLHPLPVFHYGSPLMELERICERYNYFGLGGLVPLARRCSELQGWLDKCFAIIKRYWPKKVHPLGITSQWMLERYPVYSCDSTSAIRGGGFGNVLFFERGKLLQKSYKESGKAGKKLRCVDNIGADGTAHLNRRYENIRVTLQFEKYITDLWAKRGIVWQD